MGHKILMTAVYCMCIDHKILMTAVYCLGLFFTQQLHFTRYYSIYAEGIQTLTHIVKCEMRTLIRLYP